VRRKCGKVPIIDAEGNTQFPEFADEVNVAIFRLLFLERAFFRLIRRGWWDYWTKGSDALVATADAADSLAHEIARANRYRNKNYETTRLSTLRDRLDECWQICCGWGRSKRDDGDSWLDGFVKASVESRRLSLSRLDLTPPSIVPSDDMPQGDPEVFHRYSADLRLTADVMLEDTALKIGSPPSGRGRPITRAAREPAVTLLALYAKEKGIPASEVARRAVESFGLSVDSYVGITDSPESHIKSWTEVLRAAGAPADEPRDLLTTARRLVENSPRGLGVEDLIKKMRCSKSAGRAAIRDLLTSRQIDRRGRRLIPVLPPGGR